MLAEVEVIELITEFIFCTIGMPPVAGHHPTSVTLGFIGIAQAQSVDRRVHLDCVTHLYSNYYDNSLIKEY